MCTALTLNFRNSGEMRIPSVEERNAILSQTLGLALGSEVAPPNPRSTAVSSTAASSTAASTTAISASSSAAASSAASSGSNRGIGAAGNAAQNTSRVSNDAAKESSASATGAGSKVTSSALVLFGSVFAGLFLL